MTTQIENMIALGDYYQDEKGDYVFSTGEPAQWVIWW
jgi:hypothetical protein